MAPPKFFRKSALEKLSTPEKLDQLIQVTDPRAWITLGTIALALGVAITWGINGHIKTKVQGMGILLGGEVYDIVANYPGQLMEVKVDLGDQVSVGQVVAVSAQPELELQIEEKKASLKEKELQLQELLSFGDKDSKVQQEFIAQQRRGILQQIKSNEKAIEVLGSQLETEKELLEKGLITRTETIQTERNIENLINENEQLKAQVKQTASQVLNIEYELKQQQIALQQRIAEDLRRIKQLKTTLDAQSQLRSQHNGQIVEVMTTKGAVLQPGTLMFKVSSQQTLRTDNLRGVLYLPSKDGKKVKEDMEALVVPATVKPQEFGYIKGTVIYVSEFPSTQQGMMNVLKNEQLVREMLAMGAPFEVHVEFERDPSTTSGFAWTSQNGPPIEIYPGTPCSGRITVMDQSPVSLVIPALKKFFETY